MKTRILIVDNSAIDRKIISKMMVDFDVITAVNGIDGLRIIDENPDIELVILDLFMPMMNGFQLLGILKSDEKYSKIRVIILTNAEEIEYEIKGLKLGAVDYIRKPVNFESLLSRIDIQVKLKEACQLVAMHTEHLDQIVAERTKEAEAARDITILALVGLLEIRDIESFQHTTRTQMIMRVLCESLRTNDKYKDVLTDSYIFELIRTSPLHDIGKVGIPDNILFKPGKLSAEEFEIMKKHVGFGSDSLKKEQSCKDEDLPYFIKVAIEIIDGHHEKYDGTGYPRGLSGEDIPLPGRLMAIVDVYDALMTKRIYKEAWPFPEVTDCIRQERGKHFDPDIVDAFMAKLEEIHGISIQYDALVQLGHLGALT
ncbi:MAG: response regulator [Synergistota bacterium]|nr:response regulator [Synergistota bacterium]